MESLTIKLIDNLKQEMVDSGVLTAEYFDFIKKEADLKKQNIGNILIEKGLVSDETIFNLIGEKLNIPYVKLEDYEIDKNVLKYISYDIAQRFKVIPIFQVEDVLTVAMADPMDIISADFIMAATKCHIEVVLSSEQSIMSAIERLYEVQVPRSHGFESSGIKTWKTIEKRHFKEEYDKLPVIKTVNECINKAMIEGASDIHFDPQKDSMLVRFRIDGFLYDRDTLPANFINPIVSRIKVMSGMDISKKITPQSGRINLVIGDHDVNIRVSTFPAVHGESVVLRIFNKTARPLLELGFSNEDLSALEKVLKNPQGLVIIAGPEGSGKTTTICSVINSINTGDKNIVTIENPVEYEIKGAVQSQINPKAGLSFAETVKSAVSQDPDIIYTSNIRDFESVETVARYSLSGYLILSTFYANDAVSSVARLMDIGVDPLLLSSALNCLCSQRLVRRICPKCSKEYKPDESLLEKLNFPGNIKYYKGTGCDLCNGTGYSGRIGLFEVLVVSNNIRNLIAKQSREDEILRTAKKEGMKTLFEDGFLKVIKGITTLDEMIRIF